MTLLAVIIADDLTGALDTSTPFVEAGLTVAVAIEPGVLAPALALEPDILAVNTASRGLSSKAAVDQIALVLAGLGPALPDILFKKIDSRLKGNVAAESLALARISGRHTIVVAPAIPDQQRFTIGGAVSGRGVEAPLPIRALFGQTDMALDIIDATDDADLDRTVSGIHSPQTVLVGARGLGSALARSLARSLPLSGSRAGQRTAPANVCFAPMAETLFAFGSRDPITAAQIDRLQQGCYLDKVLDAPAGSVLQMHSPTLPAVIRCTGEMSDRPDRVVSLFAEGISQMVGATRPDMLMMGGGDTALAILQALGAKVLMPCGEIEAGMPWFQIGLQDGRSLVCAVKSGSFGNADSLLKLIPENLLKQIGAGKPARDNTCGEKHDA
ncbi:four-carbon acid sugar kinase family protein [Pararhizobium antarcticum]|uniref:Hrp-dependent type III effector protein n=1 Tax=Pararhizobium antarcticum TaxID=1798805 RepID=A0A657LZR4_9HYPH|nr:four-carbon acid sugar kinase family protein [Pararhizobium antarcticum]OJF98443.1 hypothetical protein AX761_01515 [Rhizobium sp. 58]OJG01025.1 hypothetical protein AX760_09355 [Pararhizobium antarcticum]